MEIQKKHCGEIFLKIYGYLEKIKEFDNSFVLNRGLYEEAMKLLRSLSYVEKENVLFASHIYHLTKDFSPEIRYARSTGVPPTMCSSFRKFYTTLHIMELELSDILAWGHIESLKLVGCQKVSYVETAHFPLLKSLMIARYKGSILDLTHNPLLEEIHLAYTDAGLFLNPHNKIKKAKLHYCGGMQEAVNQMRCLEDLLLINYEEDFLDLRHCKNLLKLRIDTVREHVEVLKPPINTKITRILP